MRTFPLFSIYLGLAAHREAPRRRTPLPYLTPEYLPGLPAFARRYFEAFYARLKPPLVLVFDNCQEVPPDARFYEVVRESLGLAPSGICLVLISRAAPPPALSRPLANRAMILLGWEELRFNRSEAEELLRKSYPQTMPEKLIPQVYERTEGWAAGLVLLALSIARETALPRSAGELHYEKIFDYFASEIFEKTDNETQAFLLKTAFLPQMTARMAQQLTGRESSVCLPGLLHNPLEDLLTIKITDVIFSERWLLIGEREPCRRN